MKNILTLLIVLSSLVQSNAQTQIKMYTTLGDIELLMYDSVTPITSGNFIDLTDSGYYDGIIFHRVIPSFMIQGGDPLGTGFGGPGYAIQDEFDSTLSNIQGTISMANSGPNTGGSQFFINLVNNTQLDFDKTPFTSAHPVFGIVVNGFQTVVDIGNVPRNGQNKPNTDVVMDSVRITFDPNDPPATVKERQSNVGKYGDVVVFPNPVTSASVLAFDMKDAGELQFTVIDMMGRELHQSTQYFGAGKIHMNASEVIPSGLSEGMYFIKLSSESSSQSIPVIVD